MTNTIPETSVLLPSYNGADVLNVTLRNILRQSYTDYELVINDDRSSDATEEIVRSFDDPRIRFARNDRNLGYPGNLEVCRQRARGRFLFLMGQDDILARDAMKQTIGVLSSDDDIGAVTRPCFQFDRSVEYPVRVTPELNPSQNEIVRIGNSYDRIVTTFSTLGQLTGLAFRTAYIDIPFHQDIFPCHIYPFASIMKKHPIVFLKDFTVAVRIGTSQCRHVSSIYNKSPNQSWVEMFETVFREPEFSELRRMLIRDYIGTAYIGFIQLRNYSTYRNLLREIGIAIRCRPMNLLSPTFWFFALGCMATPPFLLIPLVDWYKNHIHAKTLNRISFEYDI
jgi:glycosyltransferase involved in cell wall biosynthesis